MPAENKTLLLPFEESLRVQRAAVDWINTCPELPASVTYEALLDDQSGICISTIQAPYKARRFICGGYRGEYQFGLVLRVQPSNSEDQLQAVELLNRVGSWVETNPDKPDLGETATAVKTAVDSGAALLAAYEDGTRDYHITITMNWEVI